MDGNRFFPEAEVGKWSHMAHVDVATEAKYLY